MNIFKIFIVFLALVKINDSQTHKYCKHSLFNTKGINIGSVSGERFSIPIDYKRHTIEVVNNARNKLNTPMNYVNWDNKLDNVAINLLTKILTYSHCAIEESKTFPCLVSTPLRKDLYVFVDQTRFKLNTNKETFFQIYFYLTNSDFFHSIANTEQTITSVGCGILRIPASCYWEPLRDIMSILCLFSGVKGTLLPNKTDNWTNLYGPNYSIDMKYTKVEDLFDINENDIYFVLYGLNIFIYVLFIIIFVFWKYM